jgi:branched-chain amino acid aminotransferase
MSKICLHKFFILNAEEKPVKEWNPGALDRGKSVYEIIRIIQGIPLFLEDHLERFNSSIELAGNKPVMAVQQIPVLLQRLIRLNVVSEGNIMFLFQYPDPAGKPFFLAWFVPHSYPAESDYLNGVSLSLYHAERENREAKILQKELRARIRQKIEAEKVYEVLLVDSNGYITEGSRSNFFAIKNGRLYTAPANEVLSGITRKYIYKICRKKAIPILEEKVHETSLHEFDTCFISGTSPKVLPVSVIGKTRFNVRNQILLTIMQEYDAEISDYVSKGKVV